MCTLGLLDYKEAVLKLSAYLNEHKATCEPEELLLRRDGAIDVANVNNEEDFLRLPLCEGL